MTSATTLETQDSPQSPAPTRAHDPALSPAPSVEACSDAVGDGSAPAFDILTRFADDSTDDDWE